MHACGSICVVLLWCSSTSAAAPTVLYWFIKAQLELTTYIPIKVGDNNKLILQ